MQQGAARLRARPSVQVSLLARCSLARPPRFKSPCWLVGDCARMWIAPGWCVGDCARILLKLEICRHRIPFGALTLWPSG